MPTNPPRARAHLVLAGLLAALALSALLPALLLARPSSPVPAADTPTATAAPGPGLCTVGGRRVLGAPRVELGQSVSVQLTFTATCPVEAKGRADILLVYDRSNSMAENGKHEAALAAVQTFLDNVDFERHRVGLMPFNDAPSVIQTLTTRLDRLERALAESPPPYGSTDIARALSVADDELAQTARPEAAPVVVLLTDGRSNEEAMDAAAARTKAKGTILFTIGLGPDANQEALRRVASSPGHYDFAPGPEALAAIYERIANLIRQFTITDIHFEHLLPFGLDYEPGSGWPAEPSQTSGLDWRQSLLGSGGLTVTYRLRPTRAGRIDLGPSWVRYVDGDGILRRMDYPALEIEVVVPVIRAFYLPVLYNNQCLPAARHVDVVLALDNSNSMAEDSKLVRAVAAAKAFVRLLRMPADQAAVVAFHGEASLEVPLTGNRSLVESRLEALVTKTGTRLDKGIDAAAAELLGPRHNERNQRVLVLLTDGRQSAEPGRVLPSADLARRMGITLYAIGLGADADEAMLRAVAGHPSRHFRAAGPQDLLNIYTQIAGVVQCR
jgi:Mg-chelatase subunit ChlD